MTAMSGFFNAFWATLLTLAAYSLALWAYRRSGWGLLLPVLTGAAMVVAVLTALGVPYATYKQGAAWLSWSISKSRVLRPLSRTPVAITMIGAIFGQSCCTISSDCCLRVPRSCKAYNAMPARARGAIAKPMAMRRAVVNRVMS